MRITIILSSLACMLFTGCSSLTPISSKPPESAIRLETPTKASGFLYSALLPAGEYRPLYEDKGGYYYQAPAKIIIHDIVSYMLDGGLYVKRGFTEPTEWYVIQQNGQKTMGDCSSLPAHTLIP